MMSAILMRPAFHFSRESTAQSHATTVRSSLHLCFRTEAHASPDTETAPDDEASQELVVRSEGTVATLKDGTAGAFLQTRHWKGLEVRSGMDAPSVLEQGRGGIARGYGERAEGNQDGERGVQT